jgi:lysophospholipase L1-like esterase
MRWQASALIAAAVIIAPATAADRWITSWGSAQLVPTAENALPENASDLTIRQVVRLSAGGSRVRVRFSNVFGREPLVIGAAHVARLASLGSARLVPGSGRILTFGGRASVTIAPGAEAYADPVAVPAAAGTDLAISLYLPTAPHGQTGHPGSRATSFLIRGNHVSETEPAGAEASARWWSLADVDVEATDAAATIVAIGDSITDGYGVKPDTNQRWTDTLASRLRANPATRSIGVVNAGIGGNRVLLDGLGPNLLARFDRDVIARSGVKWVILLEGINDLGVLTREKPATAEEHAAIVTRITQAYGELVQRAHTHGIKVIAGTILPFVGNDYYHPGPETEADRQATNRFIRTSGIFDAVVDFDRLTRDPARPERLLPAFDSGDHLHPSMAGYRAMGEAVPLDLFRSAVPRQAGAKRPLRRR